MDKEKLSERYVLYQILAQNLETLKQQLQLVEQQVFELRSTLMSMEDIKKLDEKNEILLPLGSGCYGSGMITDGKNILVNAGAGVFINEDMGAAKSLLEERLAEAEKAGKEVQTQAEKIIVQMNEIASEIQEAARQESES